MKLTAARAQTPLVVNGWSIYAHPIFLDQLDALIRETLDGGPPPDSLDTLMQEAVAEIARVAGSLAKATVRSS